MSHIVYLITNTVTNKVYIGYTKYTLEKRWSQHYKKAIKSKINTPFYNAIRKYGIDAWICSIIEICTTVEQAKEQEKKHISTYDSYKNGYNATLGGDGNHGMVMPEESKKKISQALKGIPKNYNRMHGKKHANETRQKMRKPKVNKDGYQTDSFKEKMQAVQAKAAFEKRALTKEQYDKIFDYIDKGYSKKQIATIMEINYDIIKKWSLRDW
jgi:group I intron endonuclease